MATYFNKYYFEFQDIHVTSPAMWRVDIMDSQGAAPTEPYLLVAATNPLITERIDTSDDKFSHIIGRQVTVSYVYTGNPNEPLPDEFFEADERRYRIEVRKNGVLDGVYYVKPDFSQYPDAVPNFVVQLKAIDGLGYTKGTKFNAYAPSGLLHYQKIPLYEALVTRSLSLIFDTGTPINVLQSLVPNGASPGDHLLFDSCIHTDIFYDFVEGPKSVYDVLISICKAFNARIITEQNQIWIIRVQDLNYTSYTVDQYLSDTIVNTITLPDFVRTAGPNASFDSIPINKSAQFIMLPAVKKAEFEVDYKGINQVLNYDWTLWDGTSFTDWEVETNPVTKLIIGRTGAGTIKNPYKLFIPYPQISTATDIQQEKPIGEIFLGDVFDFEMRYIFTNVNSFTISICVTNNDSGGVSYRLLQDGSWTFGNDLAGLLTIGRSGKKREGTLKIKSEPIPVRAPGSSGDSPGPFGFRIEIFKPFGPEVKEPGEPDGVEIYPIKLGIISIPSKGRHITITNAANFSQVKEVEKFTFIDTGEDGVSNTIYTGPSQTPEDGGWISPKPGVNPGDIERHMAIGVIDQYQRSVNSWQGSLYSNSLAFYNVIKLDHKPDKVYMQAADRYNNRDCTHDVTLVEVFQEGTADIDDILEFDVEDKEE